MGVSPAEGQARPLVAWAAERRETDDLKPADKAIFGMVSEPPGRSESAREVASSKMRSGGRATSNLAKAAWERHIWQMSRSRSGGVISGGMVARTRYATGEILPAPMGKHRKLGRPYNQVSLGKWADGGRKSDGLIRAMNAGNAAGAKEPCCSQA